MLVLAIVLLGAAVNPALSQHSGCGSEERKYLLTFGYLDKEKDNTDDDIKAGCSMFQLFNSDFGLNDTGVCDEATVALMKRERCGCEDMIKQEPKMMPPQNFYGPQEYNIGSTKWTKKILTWTVTKYPRKNNHLTNQQVDDAMRRGLQIWADKTTLRFQHVSGNDADIKISFEVRRHTASPPYYDFDGRSGTLAHAFFPRSGIVHFDDDENFQLNTDQGTELYIVAAHEFGHTLGISHSNDKDALMAPYYKYDEKLQLHYDDIGAVQALYGRNTDPVPDRTTRSPPRTTRPTPAVTTTRRRDNYPKECDMVITASFKIGRITYVFTNIREQRWRRNTYVYMVRDGSGLDINSKTHVRDMFQKNPSHRSFYRAYPRRVDAAIYVPDQRKVYLFSGTRVYRYTRRSEDQFLIDSNDGYPRWVDVNEFPERPRAAIAKRFENRRDPRNPNYYTILMSESMLWVWDSVKERVNGMAYPLKAFGQMMPMSIDSAFSADEDTIYMLRGETMYLFDVKRWRVSREDSVKDVVRQFLKGDCI